MMEFVQIVEKRNYSNIFLKNILLTIKPKPAEKDSINYFYYSWINPFYYLKDLTYYYKTRQRLLTFHNG